MPWVAFNLTGGLNIWRTILPAAVFDAIGGSGGTADGIVGPTVYVHGKRNVVARWPNVPFGPDASLIPKGYTSARSWLPPKPRPAGVPVRQPDASRPFDITFSQWTWARAAPGSPQTFEPPEGYWMGPNQKYGKT
jgi:hypothetical protein